MRTTMSYGIVFFFFNDTTTTGSYTLSLHDALPFLGRLVGRYARLAVAAEAAGLAELVPEVLEEESAAAVPQLGVPADRKSNRLNSSHANNSHAAFCLKKKLRAIVPHLTASDFSYGW